MKQKERLGKGRSFDYEKCTFPHEELEAWQLQMKVLRDLGVPPTNLELLAIERLKLSHDPKVLQEAVRLMKQRDPNYRIDLLPLNPLNILDYVRRKSKPLP